MLPKFPYRTMTVTGVIHIIFSLTISIMIYICFKDAQEIDIMDSLLRYYVGQPKGYSNFVSKANRAIAFQGGVIPYPIMMLAVGILGVLAGVKRKKHKTTHRLKLAYMITSIISASIFSPLGVALSIIGVIIHPSFPGALIAILCFADFILSIVSASVCCCCSKTTPDSIALVRDETLTGNNPPGNYTNTPNEAVPPRVLPQNPLSDSIVVPNISVSSLESSYESNSQQTPIKRLR